VSVPDKPPPPPSNKREFPRYELMASVELREGEETVILPARNLSLGGMYVGADGNDLRHFGIGHEVEVMVFNAADENHPAVRAKAKVVRFDGEGLALKWQSDRETQSQLTQLLKAIR
jgi:hypothetical protein